MACLPGPGDGPCLVHEARDRPAGGILIGAQTRNSSVMIAPALVVPTFSLSVDAVQINDDPGDCVQQRSATAAVLRAMART